MPFETPELDQQLLVVRTLITRQKGQKLFA